MYMVPGDRNPGRILRLLAGISNTVLNETFGPDFQPLEVPSAASQVLI